MHLETGRYILIPVSLPCP